MQPPLTPASEALRTRQHRAAVQRAARKAFFDLGQARAAWAAAAAAGRDAATALVNAALTFAHAPAWELPACVAAQPGLLQAVACKLARRASGAASQLREALRALRDAQAALEAAARVLAPTPGPPPPDSGAPAAQPVPFNAEAYPDMPVYASLTLSALGAAQAPCQHAYDALPGGARADATRRRSRAAQTRMPRRW